MKKWVLKIAIGIVSFLLIASAGLFLFRNSLLRWQADKEIRRMEQTYGIAIRYADLSMPSLTEVVVNGLSVVPHGRDTLLTLHHMNMGLRFSSLLVGKIALTGIHTDGLQLSLVKRNGHANYDFLFRRKADSPQPADDAPRYNEKVNRMTEALFRLLPEDGALTRLQISVVRDSLFTTFRFPDIRIADSRFDTRMLINDNGTTQDWRVQGDLNRSSRFLEGSITAPDARSRITLPYLRRHFRANVALRSIRFSLRQTEEGSESRLSGEAAVEGLTVYHLGLSPDTIGLDRCRLDYDVRVSPNAIVLDSTSLVTFNRLRFHPYLRCAKEGKWHVTMRVNQPPFPADELFGSLPDALFRHVRHLRTQGSLSYDFLLDIDWNHLDALQFHSLLKGHGFRLTDDGGTGITRMNGEFEYTAYENDRPVRTFAIGPSNPNFRPLDRISPLLQTAVLQSEDGSFFSHDGFYPGAIREALIYDLKVGRFARGGSSISMQLVKNVFLNRHKNIARKLEEALLVWLIENQHLTTKQRMFEVYLNIIEWGPLVYGAAEASHFYFDKEPADLTVNEAIFLASLIPKPKHFRSSFNPDGTLRDNQQGYFRSIARRLFAKGLIGETEADSIRAEVVLTGRAKDLIVQPDSLLPTDSLTHDFPLLIPME